MANSYIDFPTTAKPTGITPQAQVTLCSGVPWDNNYKHVRKYNNRVDLVNFLNTKKVYESTDYSFINVGVMAVSVPYNQMNALHCNYMFFKNLPWDNIEHFAFITSVKPKGANVCEINFDLDIWNESQFDMILKPCFVEREIVKKSNDKIGAHTYPEEMQCGEYVVNGSLGQIPTENERVSKAYCCACAYDTTGADATVSNIQNNASGLSYNMFASTEDFSTYVETLISQNKIDGLVDAWTMPDSFTDTNNVIVKTFTQEKPYSDINGYTPKNNKLFVYPFNFLLLTNNSGQTKELQYELFDGECKINYTVNFSPSPTLYAFPIKYKGIENDYGDSITFSNYPKIPFAVDSYKAWLAQNSNNLIISTATGNNIPQNPMEWVGRGLSDIGSTITGAVSSLLGGTDISSVVANGANQNSNSILSLISGVYNSKLQSDGIKGSISNSLPSSVGFDCIYAIPVSIKAEYARIIDDYFSMFGYKICRIKTPDIVNRKYWNYVKTVNCAVSGDIELSMMNRLRSIFDNGVTVWHTDDIGNYNLNNE